MTRVETHGGFGDLRRGAEDAAAGLPALMVEAEDLARGFPSGSHARRKPGAGEKFWQFRDYNPLDRPQDIDWRISGKGDRVYIRQKEQNAARVLYLSVDSGPRMHYASRRGEPSKSRTSAVLALATALLAARAGEQVSLAGGGLRPGRGDQTLEKIALTLSEQDSGIFLPPESLPSGGYLVAVGDFLDSPESICARIEACGALPGGALIVQVLDPAEIELPFDGRAVFEDPADGTGLPIANVAGVREAYRLRIKAHIEALADLCRHRHWHTVFHRTDSPARATLHTIWRMVGADLAATFGCYGGPAR